MEQLISAMALCGPLPGAWACEQGQCAWTQGAWPTGAVVIDKLSEVDDVKSAQTVPASLTATKLNEGLHWCGARYSSRGSNDGCHLERGNDVQPWN